MRYLFEPIKPICSIPQGRSLLGAVLAIAIAIGSSQLNEPVPGWTLLLLPACRSTWHGWYIEQDYTHGIDQTPWMGG
jgi:hypothetical protein